MLTVTSLRREFRTPHHTVVAVDDVSLEIPSGAFASIVGRSGSGKSTLLALLGGLDRPTSGSIIVDDREITALGDGKLVGYRRSMVGFVFQSYNLIPNLTALQNVQLPMEFAGMSFRERRDRAAELLTDVGLDAKKQARLPTHLSGGEQQRVSIARALANRPSLVLADEPTGNLDSSTGKKIVALLRELAHTQETTIVAVTHDTAIAARTDVTFTMGDGKLVEKNRTPAGTKG
jgi:putative ABC transport system ATP-binding protein